MKAKTISIKRLRDVLALERVPARDRNRIMRRAEKTNRKPTLESKGDCVIHWYKNNSINKP